MASFNKITIVGYLGRDPELRYTPNGNAVCNLSVATTEKRGNEEYTTWFKISAWGRQGELCNEYLAKGRRIYVEGRLTLQEYTDRDGQKRTSAEVHATDVKFLDRKSENSGEERTATRATESEPISVEREARRDALRSDDVVDPDIPF